MEGQGFSLGQVACKAKVLLSLIQSLVLPRHYAHSGDGGSDPSSHQSLQRCRERGWPAAGMHKAWRQETGLCGTRLITPHRCSVSSINKHWLMVCEKPCPEYIPASAQSNREPVSQTEKWKLRVEQRSAHATQIFMSLLRALHIGNRSSNLCSVTYFSDRTLDKILLSKDNFAFLHVS